MSGNLLSERMSVHVRMVHFEFPLAGNAHKNADQRIAMQKKKQVSAY